MGMKIGFTGTRKGMSITQMVQFERLLKELKPKEFHHGGCEGADAEASRIAHRLNIWVVCHPPTNKKAVGEYYANETLPKKNYLARNRDIVDATEELIAIPRTHQHMSRNSGTWYTIEYAKKKSKQVHIIY